jgi:hypothetical protein
MLYSRQNACRCFATKALCSHLGQTDYIYICGQL